MVTKGRCIFLLAVSLVACNSNGTTVSVKTDSLGRELDTLGRKIERKANIARDSVKATFDNLKESVTSGVDSIKRARRDTTD